MTKLPEPDRKPFYFCNKCGFMGDEGPLHIRAGNTIQCDYLAVCDNHIYTPEQMLQYGRDLLEEAPQAVPAGFVLVPVEPTSTQVKAAADAFLDCGSRLILNKALAALKAGIAAAPKGEV